MKEYKIILALLIAFLIPFNRIAHAQTEPPVVHAVLFYSPTCGHCEFVITQTILPMMDAYGGQLQVIGIDVTQQDGQTLFLSALAMFKLEQAGVALGIRAKDSHPTRLMHINRQIYNSDFIMKPIMDLFFPAYEQRSLAYSHPLLLGQHNSMQLTGFYRQVLDVSSCT